MDDFRGDRSVGEVAGTSIDASVVQMLMDRDGLDEPAARRRAEDTLRLAAARRDALQAEGRDPETDLPPARREHLLRVARANLWLSDKFEPSHGPKDIPDKWLDDEAGRRRLIHPELHAVCQLLVVPAGDVREAPEDGAWWTAAQEAMRGPLDRIRKTVPMDDPQACDLIAGVMKFQDSAIPGIDATLRFERAVLDLKACSKTAEDGSCEKQQFAEEWTEVVEKLPVHTVSDPFRSRFGLHAVMVAKRVAPREADDPETEASLREELWPEWRNEAFAETMDKIRERRIVRVAGATPTAAPSPAGPPGPAAPPAKRGAP